jgi:hypothetical protein
VDGTELERRSDLGLFNQGGNLRQLQRSQQRYVYVAGNVNDVHRDGFDGRNQLHL